MLNKVLKHQRKMQNDASEGDDSSQSSASYRDVDTNKISDNAGFHAKKNSLAGAARQRSMGNRNTKPSR